MPLRVSCLALVLLTLLAGEPAAQSAQGLRLETRAIRELGLHGRLVFFVHLGRPGSPDAELFVADLDAGTIRQLKSTRNSSFDPRWSPDGTEIAFRSDRDVARPSPAFQDEIYLMRADGTRQINLTRTRRINDGWPAWAPDGRRIAYGSELRRGPHTDLYVMNRDGTRRTLVVSSSEPDEGPDWSSRNRLVFVSWRTGDWELYAVDPDGTRLERLTRSAGEDTAARWSPDGKRIVFLSKRDARNPDHDSVYVMDANGLRQHALTRPGYLGSPAWSPDGRYVLVPAAGGLHVLDPRSRSRTMTRIVSGEIGGPPDWHR
jgi:Tol biopolymer transport system component